MPTIALIICAACYALAWQAGTRMEREASHNRLAGAAVYAFACGAWVLIGAVATLAALIFA